MADKHETALYWDRQLNDIDFSALPEAPKDLPKEATPPRPRGRLVAALLSSLLGHIQQNPRIADAAVVIFTLPGGGSRTVFPSAYTTEDLKRLAEAAENFVQSVREGQQGQAQDVWD